MDTPNAPSQRPSVHDESGSQGPDRQADFHEPHSGHMHVHGTDCGHETLPHGGHLDYVHGDHRHHQHEHHYDEH